LDELKETFSGVHFKRIEARWSRRGVRKGGVVRISADVSRRPISDENGLAVGESGTGAEVAKVIRFKRGRGGNSNELIIKS